MKLRSKDALLIGYGAIGHHHARLLNTGYRRFAIVDSNESSLIDARHDYPMATIARNLTELDLDGWNWNATLAVIATWGISHANVFTTLAQYGVKRILCEKPLAHSVWAGDLMIKQSEKYGISLGVHHQHRYSGFAGALKQTAFELDLGEPQSIVIHGGASGLVTNGIHYIDIACQIFEREPQSVVSTASGTRINPRSPELMFYGGTAVWSFGKGIEATMSFSNHSSIFRTFVIYYRDAVIEVSRRWDLDIRRRSQEELDRFPAITRTGVATNVVQDIPPISLYSADERTKMLIDEIDSGSFLICPPQVALQSLGACIGALAAGENRSRVELPINPDSHIGRTEWPIS